MCVHMYVCIFVFITTHMFVCQYKKLGEYRILADRGDTVMHIHTYSFHL